MNMETRKDSPNEREMRADKETSSSFMARQVTGTRMANKPIVPGDGIEGGDELRNRTRKGTDNNRSIGATEHDFYLVPMDGRWVMFPLSRHHVINTRLTKARCKQHMKP